MRGGPPPARDANALPWQNGAVMDPRTLTALCALLLAVAPVAPFPRPGSPQHYIFFNRERARIHDRAFLDTPAIAGAQIKYTWKELEPARDRYAFDHVLDDLAFLERRGKRLVLQLQDVTFDERSCVPDYLCTDSTFHGGAARKYEAQGDDESKARFDGWVARRWDPAVRDRFRRLLRALGARVGLRIEAIVLPETAVEFAGGERYRPEGFTFEAYRAGIRAQTLDTRAAFPASRVIQYANFMPGEWLPGDDHGYLRSVYALADSVDVGVGGPDLLPHRKGFRAHSYPLIAARSRPAVPAGVAVQDGNLAERDPVTGKPPTVSGLFSFARDSLHLDYLFWGTQEPYYSRDVLPWLRGQPAATVRR